MGRDARLTEAGRVVRQSPRAAAPQRTCVGCRARTDRSRLLRVVAEPGAVAPVAVVPDPAARLPGRGAWLHPDPDCLELAERRRAFARALRVQGPVDAGNVRAYLATARDDAVAEQHSTTSTTTRSTVDRKRVSS